MKKFSSRTASALAALTLCVSSNAYSIGCFDPSNNRLSVSTLSVNGMAYQNVSATLHSFSVLGVDNGAPGADTFDPTSNLLSVGAFEFQGTTYTNVRIQLDSFSLLEATPVVAPASRSAVRSRAL